MAGFAFRRRANPADFIMKFAKKERQSAMTAALFNLTEMGLNLKPYSLIRLG